MMRKCRKLKGEQKEGHVGNQSEKKTIVIALVCDQNAVNLTCQESNWMIDSDAYIHCTHMRDFFLSYTVDFLVVKMGNDGASKVIGMRYVCL